MTEDSALANVEALISFINSIDALSANDRHAKARAYGSAAVQNMIETGKSYGEASGAPNFLQQSEEDFRIFLKSTDNHLEWQTATVRESFEHYANSGEVPAPYYPWRVAIILAKMKENVLELRFLDAWVRHFSDIDAPGSRYNALIDRHRKLRTKTSNTPT